MDTITHTHTTTCWWNPDQARWICGTGTGTDTEIERPLVDVRDMIVVHTAMLREFRLAPAAVAAVDDGDRKRAATVDRHLGFLCDLLHHHHQGEDDLLWPVLRERAPDDAARLVDEVESQHEGIDRALHDVRAARTAWTSGATADARDALSNSLRELHVLLSEHLDQEERTVLPLAASVCTDAEWHAIGEAAVAATPKPLLPLVFGMFAYEGDPEVLKNMLSAAPAVPRLLLPRIAPRVYARRARQVYGTTRP